MTKFAEPFANPQVRYRIGGFLKDNPHIVGFQGVLSEITAPHFTFCIFVDKRKKNKMTKEGRYKE